MGLSGKICSSLLSTDFCTQSDPSGEYISVSWWMFSFTKRKWQGIIINGIFDGDKDMLYSSWSKVPPWCETSDMHHSANVEQYWQICNTNFVFVCVYVHVGTYVSISWGQRMYRLHFLGSYPSSLLACLCVFVCCLCVFVCCFEARSFTTWNSPSMLG